MVSILLTAALFIAPASAGKLTTAALDNGLTVLLQEEHERPLISVCVYVNGGSRTESDDLKGLSHYYEHIIFRGGTAGDRQKEEETRRKFGSLGRYAGYTTDDATAYYFLVPKQNFDEALWRFTDAVGNVQVTAEKVEKDRQSIVQELHMRVSDSPSGRAFQLLTETAFPKGPYRYGPIGTEAVVTGASFEKFRTFYQERYVPNHMVLAVVGDFTSAEILEKIRAQFGKYARGKASFEMGTEDSAQTDVREAMECREAAQTYLNVGFRIPAATDPDAAAIQVLQAVLTGSRAARLPQALKEKNALVSDVSSDAPLMKDPYLLSISLEVSPENAEKASRSLFAELKRLRDEPVAADELSRVRAQIEHDTLFAHQSYAAIAQSLCQFGIFGRASDEPRWLSSLLDVSAESIQRVARSILVADGCTVAAICPKAEKMPAYAAIAREALPKSSASAGAARPAAVVLRNRDKKFGFMQVVKEDRSSPVFAAAVVVRGGPLLENKPGAAHLVSRMIAKGTADLTAEQVAKRLAELGLELSSAVREDHISFSLGGPARSAPEGLALLMKLLSAPAFRADDLEKVRTEALSAIAAEADDSFALADRAFLGSLYGGSAAGRDKLGEAKSVTALSAADLSAFHKSAFVPRNVYVSVVGDVAAVEIAKLLEGTAGSLPASKDLPKLPEIARKTLTAVEAHEVPRATKQVVLDLGWSGASISSGDYLAARVASRVLGLRLFYRFVYEKGLAYRMWTLLPPRMAASPLYFQLGVSPENLEKAKGDLLEQTKAYVAELENPNVSMKAELDDVRREIVQNFQLSQETAQGQASTYAYYEAAQLGMDFVDGFEARVNAVKRGAIAEAAKKYFDPAKYVSVTVRKGN